MITISDADCRAVVIVSSSFHLPLAPAHIALPALSRACSFQTTTRGSAQCRYRASPLASRHPHSCASAACA
jgi:hypothetical protein